MQKPHLAENTEAFEKHESRVRSYCRSFPAVFDSAQGAEIWGENGRRWIDFFAGAGALNYGHNPDFIKDKLIAYLQRDGLSHGLDMHTVAKRNFIDAFVGKILAPRGLDYRIQFCGPTGANAVEAALKLARKATQRPHVVAFTGGWHGMTAGCLSVTSRRDHRATAGVSLGNVTMCPFPSGPRPFPEALAYLENLLMDTHSGLDPVAAIILETVQIEGGIYAAPAHFLQGLQALCRQHGILIIVDDIQAGCGRTGPFFSFEPAGIVPDIVCLSKSIGGYGLPMSLLLMRPQVDVWAPGEHTGTFRGNQLAFVAAAAALELWVDGTLPQQTAAKGNKILRRLTQGLADHRDKFELRGQGLLVAIDFSPGGGPLVAAAITEWCFGHGLIVERCGRQGEVIKLTPPLTISDELLTEGLQILVQAIRAVLSGDPLSSTQL